MLDVGESKFFRFASPFFVGVAAWAATVGDDEGVFAFLGEDLLKFVLGRGEVDGRWDVTFSLMLMSGYSAAEANDSAAIMQVVMAISVFMV